MKHTLKITFILIIMFFISQVIGLVIIDKYIDHKTTSETGEITYYPGPPGFEERPKIEGSAAIITIIFAIILGTIIMFIIMKYGKINILKLWLFLAVAICLYWAFSGFINYILAAVLSVCLAILKVYKQNTAIKNLTELFIYGGLAAIFVPLLKSISIGFILLFIISLYDMYAVWKSKHMIKMAQFQANSKVFAGMMIPYKRVSSKEKSEKNKGEMKNAVLGGGDMGIPLLFAGLVMQDLMLKNSWLLGFSKSLIIPFFAALALSGLLFASKKDRFYPAMPFLSIGCVIGYFVLYLVNLIG